MIKRLADARVKTQEKKVDLPGNAVIAGVDGLIGSPARAAIHRKEN